MMRLEAILAAVNAGSGPAVLATLLGPAGALEPGARFLAHAMPSEDVLATGRSRLAHGAVDPAWGPGGEGEGEFLMERLVPRKLPPWINFCCQVLDNGKTCVLATVTRVEGEVPYALGDHFAYDERNHGLLPMDRAFSLQLQHAVEEARLAGTARLASLPVPGGSLGILLEPLSPPCVPTVILAAGASRRLGCAKQLVELDGESLLRRIVRTALAGGGPVTVVTGSGAQELQAHLAGLPVEVVANPAWEEGMASSIRAGVAALPSGVSGVVLLVCDQPGVDPALLAQLQAAHRAGPQSLVACGYGGTRGTPALFPARYFPALLQLQGDRGAQGLLREEDGVVVPFPAGAWDVDRPGDLAGRPAT